MNRNLSFYLTTIFLVLSMMAFGQEKSIRGNVVDETGQTLPGVTIQVDGTSAGTITDIDGNYQITLTTKQNVLVFSYVGYNSQRVEVGNKSSINVKMESDVVGLSELIVVGYGTMKKSDLTGAVASISSDVIEKVASNRPMEALTGRVAGVNITKTSGEPGAGIKVRVRGIGSTNNSDPLYVIDGIPSGSDMEHVVPEDIESIEILKDASATAIYGNKGANGVVIVTTKSGKMGSKPVFSFNSYFGVGNIERPVKMLNATDQATLILEAAGNDNISLPSNLEARINYVLANKSIGTDWQDEIFQQAQQQNYNFSVRGGFDNSSDGVKRGLTYSLSATYYDEIGLLKETKFNKMILNSKTEYKFNSRIKLGLQTNIFHKGNSRSGLGIYNGPIPIALQNNALDSPYDLDGNIIALSSQFAANPIRSLRDVKNAHYVTDSYGAISYLDFNLAKGLDFRTTFDLSKGFNRDKSYREKYYDSVNFYRSQSELYEGRGEWFNWTSINVLTYNTTFKKDHKLIGTLGYEASFGESSGFGGTGLNIPNDKNLWYLNIATEYKDKLSAWQGQNGTSSFFGRAFYSFKDKYMVTGTLRYDGSSKFSGDNVWGLFPSIGTSWRADEEEFIKNLNIFSNLKARIGWGRVGNQASAQSGSDAANIGNYGMYYVFNNTPSKGGITTNIPTPNLRWEVIETVNLGVDMGFLNNDLTLTADYFIKDTKDMITRVSLPGYYPKDRPNANIGTMHNAGVEFSANYRKEYNDFGFSVGANVSVISNEIKKLNSDPKAFLDGGFIQKLGFTTRTEAGREIAYFYGHQTDGIFKTQEEIDAHTGVNAEGEEIVIQPSAKIGDIRFKDKNGNGVIDADDRAYLGSGQPVFTYGFNLGGHYKGFDLSALFYGMQGNEIVNGISSRTFEVKDYGNAYANRMNRFHPENNPNGNQPRVTLSDNNNNTRFSDRYIEDGSFLRLKNLQVGYTLPNKLIRGINDIRVYASAQNLITFTNYSGYDPEIGDLQADAQDDVKSLGIGVDVGTYPQPRLFLFGLNINF
ncbi:MAG: SusC/RagA family TonB-linked outer membrane protein [Candidatus Saccharimonadaceae bacterium]